MGTLAGFRGTRIYIDANIFIYAVEGVADYADYISEMFSLLDSGALSAATSELTLAEVLTSSFELVRVDIADIYRDMIRPSAWLSVIPVSRGLLVDAARLRADLKVRLPDAIHLCAAVAAGCSAFVSNDLRLKIPPGLKHALPD